MDNIALFLNGDRGQRVLRALTTAGHRITAVYAPQKKVSAGALPAAVEGIPVTSVPFVNDASFVEAVHTRSYELIIVAGYNDILKKSLLSAAKLGAINLHGGPLPHYRGGSVLNWQLINNEPSIGISLIRMDEGIDTGNVLNEASWAIGPDTTIAEVHSRANEEFARLVVETVNALAAGSVAGRHQDEAQARYWHQRNDEDGLIDFQAMPAISVHNLVRALSQPYPGAFGYRGGKKVRIFRTERTEMVIHGVPGRLLWLQGTGPYLVCADRALRITDYEIEEASGDRLRSGDRLTSWPV